MMFDQPTVFVDIETNGKMGPAGRIIEVGMIRVEDGEITEEYQSLVNPGAGGVPIWIETLTGINNNDLVHAPYFDDIASELQRILDGAIFVAHNVRFDYSFFKSHLKSLGIDYRPKLFCTVRMSRALYPEHRGHSLEKIIKRHNITVADRHRAFDDARAIYDFTQLAIAEKGRAALEQNVAQQLKTKSLPPHVDPAILSNLPQSPGIYIFESADHMPLYVGKSVNIRDRVRSHFTNDTSIAREMRLTQQSYHIAHITTDTEIEALLLESAKIKELQPLFNRQLRRKTTQSVLLRDTTDDGYATISIHNQRADELDDLARVYGVYTSRAKAKAALDRALHTFQLCPKLLGLEKTNGFCFRYQLSLCRGACGELESAESYNQRVELALERSKLDAWPFPHKIAITISADRSLIVDQWIIEGVVDHSLDTDIQPLSGGFDIDTYKILRSYVRNHPDHVQAYRDEV